jgi:hypothetical protein
MRSHAGDYATLARAAIDRMAEAVVMQSAEKRRLSTRCDDR